MPEYDLNDPTDLDIMRGQFNMYTADDWEEYIELAEERSIGYKNVNILKSAQRKAGIGKYLSAKVINWVLNLVDQLDSYDEDDEDEEE
jgi:exodeoxyribonuclease V alpha subunit